VRYDGRLPVGQALMDNETSNIFEQLLTINETLFESKQYEAAYHILAAALHCARDERNADYLLSTSKIANQQGHWLDDNVPNHPLGTQAAVGRGGTNLYLMLCHQAETHAHIIDTENRTRDHQNRIN
jgi:hypothetical protein